MARKTTVVPPSPDTINHLCEAICKTTEPMTASQIAKLLVAPHKLTEAKALPILNELVTSLRLHSFPPKTARGKPRYWHRDVSQLGPSLILAAIHKKGTQSRTDLRKAAKEISEEAFETALQSLISSKAVFEHPPLAKKKATFSSTPPSPEPYLRELGLQLTKIVDQLRAASVPAGDLRRAMFDLVDATGISLNAADLKELPRQHQTTDIDLVALMKNIEPGADNGALVAARELRKIASVDKEVFDRAVLDLARAGKLMLHRHDFPQGITSDERNLLVADGQGTYYVGMALRRGANN